MAKSYWDKYAAQRIIQRSAVRLGRQQAATLRPRPRRRPA